MKKGLSNTAVISLILIIVVAALVAIQIGRQFMPQTGTAIDKLINKTIPNKMETVVVPGTKVGEGCPTVPVENANDVVQALIDCDKQGHSYGGDIACCYKLKFSGTQTMTVEEIQEKLKQRSPHLASGNVFLEDKFHLPGSTPTVCYQDSLTEHKVRVTYIPAKCTASSGLWVSS